MYPHNSLQHYDFTGLTPNDYMDMDLSPIFGLNSRFGAVLGRIHAVAYRARSRSLTACLSKSTGLRLLGFS